MIVRTKRYDLGEFFGYITANGNLLALAKSLRNFLARLFSNSKGTSEGGQIMF